MRYYVIIDTTCGAIDGRFFWGDDRDLPTNYPVEATQTILTLLDEAGENLDLNQAYNLETKTFGAQLTASSDQASISSNGGVATITVTYPEAVSELLNLSIDDQVVQVQVTNGTCTIPFSSQVDGVHNITVSSTSHYGKARLRVEVV